MATGTSPDDSSDLTDEKLNLTDEKLNLERDRTNEELLERSNALGEDADEVIRRARERAQSVLTLARQRVDRADLESPDAQAARASERTQADAALKSEQTSADAARDDERAGRLRALLQLLATERDDTDQALAEEREAFAQMLSARDDVLAGVGHDIRNHLSILMMNGSSIMLRSSNPDTVALANAMLRSTAQMDLLLADLLDVATLGTGELVMRPAPTDLVSLVRSAVELHEPAARARSIHLAFDVALPRVELAIDGPRITRVVTNLLGNAIKFTPSGGRVAVTVNRVASEVEVAVTDTGPGIPQDQLEAIFGRYWRSETASKSPGYGLGLYIAHAIVEAHRGRIWAQNNEGPGTTFSFRLPTESP